jgi:excisionase family DNA binding protein
MQAHLIDLESALNIIGIKKTFMYKLINAGEIRPVKLGKKTMFVESEIHSWIDVQIAKRDDA